jgi:hypothetical protein
MNTVLRRPLNVEARVMDEKTGLVEYVASDETIDSYREVVRVNGWSVAPNGMPFVNSHRYGSIEDVLGKVTEAYLSKKAWVNVVQWAHDVPEHKVAQLGWKMTLGGYLNRVSVGFYPTKSVSRYDTDQTGYNKELARLELDEKTGPTTVYLKQVQVELSAVVLGANPNAVAKAYKAGVLSDEDLEQFSSEYVRETVSAATHPDDVAETRRQAQTLFLEQLRTITNSI